MSNQVYSQIFFTNILRLLEEKHWTKEQLAAASGVSSGFISGITNGRYNPSLRIMEQLADALDTPLPVLLETTDLDTKSLALLIGNKGTGLPEGYKRVSAVLLEHQAYIVNKWAEEARKQLNKAKL
ncbi:helix-turn-helix domain-containing protein [Methylobacter psychrophilus]|uniref:helix-turn-helix domain-containing protein n=1 Tax=Methylobacter psychrophilus TaxID=96941 RepID=UPI0021D4E116|nr:helix-turn-helix domain-containing protein [Methylobacter psychrophilus]